MTNMATRAGAALAIGLYAIGVAAAADSFGEAQQRYVLFDAGAARCRLVLPAKLEPEEKEAAKLLQDTFRAMTGATAAIVTDGGARAEGLVDVHVGRTTLAVKHAGLPKGLDADGFAIRAVGERDLVLVGGRSVSTFYAATEFLERYAGVLWVWPGEHGTVIPKAKRLEVTVRDQVSAPAFRARRFSGMKSAKMRLYRIHQTSRERRSEFHHNVWKVLKPEMYATHPEYFAEVNGKRRKPGRRNASWQACTSNPEVVKLFIEAAKKQFDRFPWVISFSVSQNDGSGFCTCKRCQALDVPGEPGISDRYFTFQNAVADGVAASHPDKFVCCLAYGKATRDVPKRVKLRPNTMIYAVVPTLNDVHEDIRKWSKAAPNLGVYFWIHGKPVPKFYPHRFAKYLKFLLAHNVKEVYAEVYQEYERNMASWDVDGPRVWMTAKLLWDPEADIDALVKRFCTRFYGAAAEPMVRYYQRCERAWERREDPDDFGRKWRDFELGLYNTEDADFMEARIVEALGLARQDVVRARLTRLQKTFSKAAMWARQQDLGNALDGMPAADAASADRVVAKVDLAERQSVDMARRGLSPFGGFPPECERAVDRKFDAISKALGAGALPYWRERLAGHPAIARFIGTQISLLSGELKNLAKNPGFEQVGKDRAKADPKLNWKRLDAPGWGQWIRPGTPGSVRADTGNARSGKRCVVIEGCVASCAMQSCDAVPGDRYRVSCWAKATARKPGAPDEDRPAGTLTVKWMDTRGKWMDHVPPYVVDLPLGATEWTRLSVQFTVPARVGRLVMMLGVKNQAAGEKVWFDDFAVERLHEARWTAEPVGAIEELLVPEAVTVDQDTGQAYISNVEAAPGEYWSDDGKGFVTLVKPDLSVGQLRWRTSRPGAVLNGPKGSCLLDGYLYVADTTRVVRLKVDAPAAPEVIATGIGKANDLATDGTCVWVSDTVNGKVFAIGPDKNRREIPAPAGVNGIVFHGKRLYAVSWPLHEVYELDPAGKRKPRAFGLAKHFTALDGIVVLDDGTFVVSDFKGDKLSTISPDRRRVGTLAKVETPADMGLDRKRGLLYVPLFHKDRAVVLKLTRR